MPNPVAIETLEIAHEGFLPGHINGILNRLSAGGESGFIQAVQLVQKLAMTDHGFTALQKAARVQTSRPYENEFKYISVRRYAVDVGYGRVLFGDGKTGRRLPFNRAREIVATYFAGNTKRS